MKKESIGDKLKTYRLTQGEYEKMRHALGDREPSNIEWALYSALWSEHCSYKSSKVHLRKLFTKHPRVVQGPGENAGVIDLGQGERVAFKMESHNHPSFIEPTQGAATGVGGILRDIFTMGARPIASMDYLCFGKPLGTPGDDFPRLLNGVVKGVGGYGNCVGVATVNGQTTFHKSYTKNNLVNAFSLGLFRPGENIFYGRAQGVGNLVVYAGARTGRDGIHGAAMASESFENDLSKKKPNVQIGDPFFEKLLIEACLEVMKEKLVVGIQDMGAAGLTSSTFEMAARAQSGLKLDLKKVPLRESNITPEEILLSESQERMILVVESSKYKRVEEIFKRWDLNCTVIGEITAGDQVQLFWGAELLTSVSHKPLVDGAPVYERPYSIVEPPRVILPEEMDGDFETAFESYLSSLEGTSREWITKQYDQRVGARTFEACDESVALLKLSDSARFLAMNTGCRPLLCEWHIETGAKDAIVLPCLQMAARGAKALAVTDCLNFGNPEKKEIMGQFVAAIQSLDQACRIFDTPIISGNVSLYNETLGESIIPTPATGVVGLCERDPLKSARGFINDSGQDIFLVRTLKESTWLGEFNSSHGRPAQGAAYVDLPQAKALYELFLELSGITSASQVVSKGGIAHAFFKLTRKGIGAKVDWTEKNRTLTEILFAERFYAGIWVVEKNSREKFESLCQKEISKIAFTHLGQTGGGELKISVHNGIKNKTLSISLEELKKSFNRGLENFAQGLSQ